MKIKTILNDIGFIPILFILSLFLVGGFHEYIACFIGMAACIWLLLKWKEKKQFRFVWNYTNVALLVLVFSYLINIFWAVDSGMAFLGFLKFFSVFLFLLGGLQAKSSGDKILKLLPGIASVLVVVSIVCMYLPVLEKYFNVAGRLAGTFQYPNTFAIFLLVAELLILSKEKLERVDYVCLPIIIGGLLFTGSRSAFVLAILSNICMVLLVKNKYIRRMGTAILLIVILGILVFMLLGDGTGGINRLLQISFKESTFVGRILYFIDALPLVLRNPFGLGYMGYYYTHTSVQTGVYSVMYIHNDFLQFLLDVGWIPFLLFVIAIVKSLLGRKKDLKEKLILLVMILHSCFDFNLQFVSMFFLLVLFMDYDSGKEVVYRKYGAWAKGALAVVSGIFLWCGVALFLSHIEGTEIANKLYPWNTQNQTKILAETTDLVVAEELADNILKRNEFVPLVYSIKSKGAYSRGDIEEMIQYKNKVFAIAPFLYEEYEEYCYMLINSISLYMQTGDQSSAEFCIQELIKTYDQLTSSEQRLSELGKMIKDQPTTQLPDDIVEYVNKLKK